MQEHCLSSVKTDGTVVVNLMLEQAAKCTITVHLPLLEQRITCTITDCNIVRTENRLYNDSVMFQCSTILVFHCSGVLLQCRCCCCCSTTTSQRTYRRVSTGVLRCWWVLATARRPTYGAPPAWSVPLPSTRSRRQLCVTNVTSCLESHRYVTLSTL